MKQYTYVCNALIESRVNLASDRKTPMNFNYPVYKRVFVALAIFVIGFKSHQTARLRILCFSSSLLYLPRSLEGISRAERDRRKSVAYFAASLGRPARYVNSRYTYIGLYALGLFLIRLSRYCEILPSADLHYRRSLSTV